VTFTFHALWMLCALGAVVLVTAAARRLGDRLAAGAGFVAAVIGFGPDRLPDPMVAGTLAASSAALVLFRPRYAIAAAACAGALAGMWSALVEVQGLPSFAAVALGAMLMIVPVWLGQTRSGFASERLRDEGLLVGGALGLAVALLPGVLDGWQAATNLAASAGRQAQAAVPIWAMALLLTSMLLGVLYSLWSRR
jgi:hypothetical protein